MGKPSQSDYYQKGTTLFCSWYIWHVAADAAQRARKVKRADPQAHTSDTLAAITIATIAAEAFLDEIQFLADDHDLHRVPSPVDWKTVAEVLSQLEDGRASVTVKYLLTSRVLPRPPLQPGANPYQDFDRLVKLRNAIVHLSVQQKPPRFFAWFVDRKWTYDAPDADSKVAGWLFQLETPEVACWACRAARNIILDIVNRIDIDSENWSAIRFRTFLKPWTRTEPDKRIDNNGL